MNYFNFLRTLYVMLAIFQQRMYFGPTNECVREIWPLLRLKVKLGSFDCVIQKTLLNPYIQSTVVLSDYAYNIAYNMFCLMFLVEVFQCELITVDGLLREQSQRVGVWLYDRL